MKKDIATKSTIWNGSHHQLNLYYINRKKWLRDVTTKWNFLYFPEHGSNGTSSNVGIPIQFYVNDTLYNSHAMDILFQLQRYLHLYD